MNSFSDWVSLLSNGITGISAGIVAILAFVGIRQWRTELTGKAKYEVARKIVLLTFQIEEAFSRARHPVILPEEGAGRTGDPQESEEMKAVLDEYHARVLRLKPLLDLIRQLKQAGWEAEVVLQRDVSRYVKYFEEQYNRLFRAVLAYMTYQKFSILDEDDKSLQQDTALSEITDTIMDVGEHDQFAVNMRRLVAALSDSRCSAPGEGESSSSSLPLTPSQRAATRRFAPARR